MLSNTLFGCIIFLLTNISLLYVSHLLVRRFYSNAPSSVRLVAIGTLFYSFIVLIFQALSPFHAITRTWVTISCLLLALISHLIWGGRRNIRADLDPIRLWLRDGLTSRWSALLIICGFVILLTFSRTLLTSPCGWDSLTYHLTFAALWIKKGTLFLFKAPDQIIQCGHFPINGEIFASWLLLPFHNDILVNTMNFPITLLGGISCYAIARELGLTKKEASFAPLLICFTPMMYTQIMTATVDIAVFTFCSASVLFTLRYLRRGYINDGLLTFIATGILLGIKYTAIPIVSLIFIVTTTKTISLVRYPGLFKKLGLIFLGLLLICTLGGRKYIHNTIEAGNPLFPYFVKIFNYEIFTGSYQEEQLIKEWDEYDEEGGSKFSLWEREYTKFCYLPLTAGPKFLLFLILALISIFTRPRHITKTAWYSLTIIWVVPLVLYFVGNPAGIGTRAKYANLATRYLAPSIALFTIQGLVVIKKFGKHFKGIDFLFVALVAWDLLFIHTINITHIWEVAISYPFMALMIPLILILFKLAVARLKRVAIKEETSLISAGLSKLYGIITRQWVAHILVFIVLFGGLYLLQGYRDNTRYTYYRKNVIGKFTRNFVNGWEFLDNPDEKKTIAMTIGGNRWFFYPLLGRWLQNDIVYLSAKNKWDVPTFINRGLLRGNDFSIWFYNLKKKNVDYILISGNPWPIELRWIQLNRNEFQLVFSDINLKIYKYTGESKVLND